MQRRSIIVTGVSSGIGEAIAKKLIADGMHVLGISRRSPKFSHENLKHFAFDLKRIKEIPSLCRSIIQTFPKVNGLLCNAGSGLFGNLEELSFAEIDAMIDIHLRSNFALIKTLLPHFKRQEMSDLLFMGSEAGLQGKRQGSIYCACKFALRGFAQALREECAGSHVRVSIIQPGMVRTSFHDSFSFEPGKEHCQALLPHDVAEAASLILNLPSNAVCDELILSPLKKVLHFKNR